MIAKRFRMMYKFWLDVNKPDEFELSELIEELKQQHLFAKTIRDGLRLVASLRQGRVDVLLELFPFVADELQPKIIVPENSKLQQEIGDLRRLIEGELAATANGSNGNGQVGPKAMSVPKFDAPAFNNNGDLGEIVIKKDTSTQSAQNFINSMMNLQA